MKAVILAGGQGTRFWPVSRRQKPKQFLNITGTASLLQQTVRRLHPLLDDRDIYVVCSPPYVSQVRLQLPQLSAEQVIVEPVARNTAPCVGLAALTLRSQFPEEVMAVLPADHVIDDVDELHSLLAQAAELARRDWLVTFGVRPSYPATGYGYVERGEEIEAEGGRTAYRAARFTEKPDLAAAASFVESGRYFWNSGMFVWSIPYILGQIEELMPSLHEGLLEIEKAGSDSEQAHRRFASLESLSLDYGIMEKAQRVALLPCDLGWSDVGGWQAVADLRGQDEQEISSNALYVAHDSRRCIVQLSDRKMAALVGVEDLIVVDTPDALLICRRDRAEEIRSIVQELERRNLVEYL